MGGDTCPLGSSSIGVPAMVASHPGSGFCSLASWTSVLAALQGREQHQDGP